MKPLRVVLDLLLVAVATILVASFATSVVASSSEPLVSRLLAAGFVVMLAVLVAKIALGWSRDVRSPPHRGVQESAPSPQDVAAERRRTALRSWYLGGVVVVCTLGVYVVLFTDNPWPWSLVNALAWALLALAWHPAWTR